MSTTAPVEEQRGKLLPRFFYANIARYCLAVYSLGCSNKPSPSLQSNDTSPKGRGLVFMLQHLAVSHRRRDFTFMLECGASRKKG